MIGGLPEKCGYRLEAMKRFNKKHAIALKVREKGDG